MHCFDVQPDFEAYVGGERGSLRAVFLEQYLAGCDACRAELARLQAVVDAPETWPLIAEPARLRARVMAQVRPRPALPHFRVYWSDLAISLAGAGVVFAFTLLWRYLSPMRQVYLVRPQVYLRLEVLRLEATLWIQELANTGAVMWGQCHLRVLRSSSPWLSWREIGLRYTPSLICLAPLPPASSRAKL